MSNKLCSILDIEQLQQQDKLALFWINCTLTAIKRVTKKAGTWWFRFIWDIKLIVHTNIILKITFILSLIYSGELFE